MQIAVTPEVRAILGLVLLDFGAQTYIGIALLCVRQFGKRREFEEGAWAHSLGVLEFSCFSAFVGYLSLETVPDAATNTIPFEVSGIDKFLQVDFDRIAIRTRQFNGILYRHPATLAGEIEKLE